MKSKRFNNKLCNDALSFDDCELAILRHAVDESEKMQGQKVANSEEVKKIIGIVENFLVRKKLVCYGGTAINNILPKYAQFYNKDLEIPDYDFYSPNALDDAIELADIYYKAGYLDVEAKSGVHHGTFKVFVNFIPVADITFLERSLYSQISKEAIVIAGINYSPPNLLRMNMFLELSRPDGDVSRWEKVLKRLTILNKFYPLKPDTDCETIDFQRKMDTNMEDSERLYYTIRDSFVSQSVVFFGGYAVSLYSKYMKENEEKIAKKIPDFDVLSEDIQKCALILKENLHREGFKNVKIIKHKAIGELIPKHIQINVNGEIMAFIYEPIACHSYNTISIDEKEINVATIDTILTFYLAFTYANLPYYDKNRLLCMAKFLFDVEQKNRLEQKGLLKRFSLNCYGKQPSMEDLRSEKAKMYKELINKKDSKEYKEWFLKYNPNSKSDVKSSKTFKPIKGKKNRTRKQRVKSAFLF
jgi:hypothetical protein